MQTIYEQASQAAYEAFHATKPAPMVVTDSDIFGNVKQNGNSYYVADGICGFAWVKINPARGKFVTWCKNNGIGRKDSYEGGYRISNFHGSICSQSYERNMQAARAFAQVLCDNGIKAYADGRLD